ncbi:MAG: ABC transporter ATP-binding protein [Mesorhizobium sp.]|uniref:ABC transporter ATP-binding protein n=1 Tax=unclassified Mesorhizobium TaxID=325217 RepID=UPI000F7628E5|nr:MULTISPECIES: ABC transporter ATP-binding protein [unclassified Mesorhizobium]AZO50287.1 ABC transporter ATP-binding protein [Mesorhizobium sp. M4B.F.Ca.ET.058.02.1.1]RWD32124.1 MAG: ATP-binding cassette domain-containing protein [Mesorhizobium sp.]TIW11035.1 MAG: ABC transporter ATP-binding protein [Mesorhizobium sp.]TIW36686.1 MAG: ABC transporter ATP-binding protein [Mesorhizobium sp.]
MTRFLRDLRDSAFCSVLAFTVRHWTREPARLVIIMTAILGSALADVLTPLYSGRLVDAVARASTTKVTAWDPTLTASFMLVAITLGAVVTRHVTFMGINHMTLRMMSDVAGEAFHRVQRFSTAWHANSFAGSTVRKISRGMWALDLMNYTILNELFRSLLILIGSTALLGWNWPMMGLIVGSGSLFYVALTFALSLGYVAPAATLANSCDTRISGSLADAISCNAVVRSFGAEAREDERLAAVVAKWRHRMRRSWFRGTINMTAQGLTLVVLRASVIGYASILWSRGQATPGDVALVLASFFVVQGYLGEVGMHLRKLQRSVNDMEEVVDIQNQPLGVADIPGAKPIRITEGSVDFENVYFDYGNHHPIYTDFSISIKAGERVGLVGPSGSGKTTFVKLIQRLYDVNGGRIMIDGQDVSKVTQTSLRSQIAMVHQDPVLFHRTLSENIGYGRPGASQAEIEEAARLASAHEFIEGLPKGYSTLVGERGVKLSGGERQRVAIARAFLASAPVLILDEATSSLDSESEVLIQKAMERLMVGRTTLVIAHRLATVRTLDRLLVFDGGHIIEEGDHAALTRLDGGTYRRLFERQALELAEGLASGA